MAHLQYLPGDPRLVDQLVCELKSKGIFDQFRKDCIADVDTRPAYQNLRQRVESSVASFLARQTWKPDLNKNQLREKLRKHLLDANYLEQGVERIVDQVVNPKVASVFIPQVEDLVYNYLGIPRKKPAETAETSNGKVVDLLPTDLEAVSPGSVKSNDDKSEAMDISVTKDEKMEIDNQTIEVRDDSTIFETIGKEKEESRLSGISELTIHDSDSASIDKSTIPLPAEEIKLENIPAPECSPPNIKNKKIDLEKIDLPKEPNLSTDIPLPDEMPKVEKELLFNPLTLNSEDDDDSSSDSSLRRNMSPLTPIRNFDNENSCDAQQGFDNDSDSKMDEKKEPTTFRFTIEKSDASNDALKVEKKETEPISNQTEVYQFSNQIDAHTFNTPLYDDSSNSHNLQIDYESDANSKTVTDIKLPEADQNSGDSNKKEKKEEKRSSHKSSHRSRDSSKHSSSKDKKFDPKHSNSRDSSRQSKDDKKFKDDKSKSSHKERSSDRTEKKDSRDSSKQRISSSHKSSNSKDKDSKHGTSRSSKHSSSSKHDDKKSSSSKEKEKSDKSSDRSSKDKKDSKDRDSKSSSHRSDKDKKSSSKSKDDRDKENKERKEKKSADDHYSLSGRGNPNRRSTDRDSNDGSSSSKGSHNPSNNKSSESRNDNKGNSKSGNTSSSGDSTSPSDSVGVMEAKPISQNKAIRVDSHLEVPVSTPARLPFVPDVTLKKPKFAANLEEAKKMIKMRKFLEEEQKRMNQEAALLLEFQANVRPSLSQVYSSVPGPELEFACVSNTVQPTHTQVLILEDNTSQNVIQDNNIGEIITENENMEGNAKVEIDERHDAIAETLFAMHQDGNTKMSEYQDGDSQDNVVKDEFVEQSNEAVIETLSKGGIKCEDKITITVPESDCAIRGEYKETSTLQEKRLKEFEAQETHKKHEDSSDVECITAIEVSDNKETEIHRIIQQELKYFADHEKFTAEIERDKFNKFYLQFKAQFTNKMYLVNCDTYEENIVREVAKNFGEFEIINYIKNGHLKLPKGGRNIIKNVNLANEITLPTNTDEFEDRSPVFSPVRSECSFELSSDYDAKLEEMVIKTSRQEIMEIILGSAVEDSTTKLPEINYCMDSNIESEDTLKRKFSEVESSVNNNMQVLTPNKQRKLSETDQISSTTEENTETSNNNNTRSKFLGKARRVGLPRPKRSTLPNSPSSDKSVENYEQNAPTPNGKLKTTPRTKVQRFRSVKFALHMVHVGGHR
ncbi:biorientation of chromosomes in cell division protein 1-like 1 isoform X2 [Hyposmocoma kahamanoa]|uniref:biorientation of chromosomes in cell division protein 1-like 1 isoform X2 n=1 Tax=Hyposmocoma kahamanoa TaxID=1477025 RepID=UPI000E6D5AE9|nr:biorientation of chromosomes in cell division protein 1-like 1 isoform X2 [Hyposmocoma kahamanoa]